MSVLPLCTALQSAEWKLAERDAGLRRLVDSNIVAIAIAGMQSIKNANDEYLRILGMTRDDLRSGHVDWQKATPPDHLERDMKGIEELRRRGYCTPFEKEYIRPDGTRVPVLIGLRRYPSSGSFLWLTLARKNAPSQN
jgi:PAS domain S-box-containing protein